MGKINTLLIDAIGSMVFLRSMLPEKETYGKGNSGVKGNKICTYYDFYNHTDDCYKKHGYPPGHKLYKVQNPNINNVIREEGDCSPLRSKSRDTK